MPRIPNTDRNQLQMIRLKEMVEEEPMARLIDSYCMSYDAERPGFVAKGKSHEGRPAWKQSRYYFIDIIDFLMRQLQAIHENISLTEKC